MQCPHFISWWHLCKLSGYSTGPWMLLLRMQLMLRPGSIRAFVFYNSVSTFKIRLQAGSSSPHQADLKPAFSYLYKTQKTAIIAKATQMKMFRLEIHYLTTENNFKRKKKKKKQASKP